MSFRLKIITNTSPLPPLYGGWMEQWLGGPIPHETNATCAECAMCPDPGSESDGSYYFSPSTKCCTYQPEVPNFLVGRVLREDDTTVPAGRATVEKRVRGGVGVSPVGLKQGERFKLLFGNTVQGFGRAESLLCPHFIADDGGRCGVWQHRESTCATWFCKHLRGVVSKRFWDRLHQLLSATEEALARWCLLKLDLGTQAFDFIFPYRSPRDPGQMLDAAEVEGLYDTDKYKLMWGNWEGREEEFYKQCALLVDNLTWTEVMLVIGPEIRILAEIVRDAYKALVTTTLPARIRVGTFTTIGMTPSASRVQSYSFLDPLDLPRPLLEVLHLFDGRLTTEILREIDSKLGAGEFSEAAVLKLLDFKILVPFEPPPS